MRGANRGWGGCWAEDVGRGLAWDDHSGCRAWRVSCAPGDGRRLPRHLVVEDALGRRLGQGVPVGYGIDGRLFPGRRPACPADARRLGGLADMIENPPHGGGPGDQGDDAHSVRYGVDCRRSCSQGQRPVWVGDRPFADTSGRASSRRSLTGHMRPLMLRQTASAAAWTADTRRIHEVRMFS